MTSSALNIHAMNWSIGQMEQILYSSTKQDLPDRQALELRIKAAQESIERLLETPYTQSLEQKREYLAKLNRDYAEAYGAG